MTNRNSWLRSELPQLLFLVLFVFAARSSLADHYLVPTGSMEETIQIGDRVFVDKMVHGLRVPFTKIEITGGRDVARGEVVIFDSPQNGTRLIKRIVAVGGDRVSIRNGHITINGIPLVTESSAEKFGTRKAYLNLRAGGGPDHYMEQIPDGMLLAIGDHRGNSLDGRFFGLISEDDIYGRAVAIYYRRGAAFVWKPL